MELFDYIGATLRTKPGVSIRNFDTNDTNILEFRDITKDGGGTDDDNVPVTTTIRTFPFVAAGNITFSDNLVNEADVDTLYKMFFQRTFRQTGTDIAMTAPSGNTGTLASSTATNFTTRFGSGSPYLLIGGFTGVGTPNNGMFQVDGTVTNTAMPLRKVNNEALIVASAGPSVTLDDDPYDSPDAIVVNRNAGTPITGEITGASIAFDFDYDNNVQGGRAAATDAPIAIIAQGKAGAQWVDGLFTITRATGLNFPMNASDERVYTNP